VFPKEKGSTRVVFRRRVRFPLWEYAPYGKGFIPMLKMCFLGEGEIAFNVRI
jgi:hypothetical protein